LTLQLVGDDRLAAGYLLDRHVQALLGKQPVILRDVQAAAAMITDVMSGIIRKRRVLIFASPARRPR
jgi:hypothetical protein